MKQHITLIAVINIVFGALKLFLAAVVLVAVVGGGLISGDPEALFITSIVGPAVSGFLFLLAVPSIVGGVGLLKGRNWARVLVLVLAVFGVFDFPIGTAISVYTFWALLNEESTAYFENLSGSKLQATSI